MDHVSTVSLVVTAVNSVTVLVSAIMLLLVYWQNPHSRINQIFSAMVLVLLVYSLSLIMARYIDTFHLDPEITFYINTNLYGIFLILLLAFTLAFTGNWKRGIHPMLIGALLIFAISTYFTWTGQAHASMKPSAEQGGSYVILLTPIGLIFSGVFLVYPVISAVMLWKNREKNGRVQHLWVAPLLILFGIIWTIVIWPIVLIPLNGLTLAVATFILGRAVLMNQLFNPLAQLSAELAAKNSQLREADRLKSQFLANMSHELRTPLNSIIGYTDLVADGVYGDVTPQQFDRLEKVTRNARSLLTLINDILDLSRIEAGSITLNTEAIKTSDMLDNVLTVLDPQIHEKKLTILREYADAPAVFADPMRTRQILTNILSNAVKFTAVGHIRIKAFKRGQFVQFEIEDTGIGIPQDKQSLVFEEFRQVDSTSTRQYGGTGLGMSITRHLVKMSQGEIWLKSQPGVGTTFFFTLPVAENIPATVIAHTTGPQPTSRLPSMSGKQLRALIVDDSNDSQLFLKDALLVDNRAWQVYTANSGREGLRFAQQIQPHVILLDVMMPSMDGWQVLKSLKEDATLASIPVVIVSAIDNHFLAKEMGASAILNKPVDRAKLQEVLEQILTPA
ncbi:MAG: response regulator [Chloroflexi bacterium]|nr:response regulator [Chloroflexota bacterium]